MERSSHRDSYEDTRTVESRVREGSSSMDASWIERHGVSPVELARCVGTCSHARSTPDPLPPTKHTPLISPTRPPEKFRRGAMATRPVSAEPTARRVLGLVIKRGIYSLALVNSQVDHPAPSPSPPALACWRQVRCTAPMPALPRHPMGSPRATSETSARA